MLLLVHCVIPRVIFVAVPTPACRPRSGFQLRPRVWLVLNQMTKMLGNEVLNLGDSVYPIKVRLCDSFIKLNINHPNKDAMTLSEILPTVNQLSHQDKLRLIHFLLLVVAKEEGCSLETSDAENTKNESTRFNQCHRLVASSIG